MSGLMATQPTQEERDSCLGGKWKRKGLWWFRFEIRSTQADDRTLKPVILATKDASDHTFAVKTANWGWQQFAKRDLLFVNPHVLAADSFTIVCTIQAQPQPPAGYWLGVGLRPRDPTTQPQAVTAVQGRDVGSGGGLSAWAGGEGAAGASLVYGCRRRAKASVVPNGPRFCRWRHAG